MAKKAKKFNDDQIANSLIEKYGDIIKSGSDVLSEIKELNVIPFTPAIDAILGGGIREGTVVGLAGDPKVGKTTAVLHFAATCQKLGKQVIYLNVEGRMNSNNFDGIKDLDVDGLKIVESTEESIVPGEHFLEVAEAYGKNCPGCVIIIDSLSSLIPKNELEGELNAQTRNSLPRLLAQFFKKSGHYITRNNIILVCVAHNIANTSPMAKKAKKTDCGTMFQYQVGTNIEITHKSRWEPKVKGDPDPGQIIHWKVLTSNTGGIPNSTTEGYLRYGIGIDEIYEITQSACQFAFFNKGGGGWYTLNVLIDNRNEKCVKKYLESQEVDLEDDEAVTKALKFRGAEVLSDFLNEQPEMVQLIKDKIMELYQ